MKLKYFSGLVCTKAGQSVHMDLQSILIVGHSGQRWNE